MCCRSQQAEYNAELLLQVYRKEKKTKTSLKCLILLLVVPPLTMPLKWHSLNCIKIMKFLVLLPVSRLVLVLNNTGLGCIRIVNVYPLNA